MEGVRVATEEELPVIDVGPLYSAHASEGEKSAVAAAIRKACVRTGFFYVSGHGLSTAPLFECMHKLFDLPLAEKAKLDANLSQLHRGYTGLGGSHNCVPEESCIVGPDNKESYLLGAEGTTSPMHGPNTWPDETMLPGWQQQVQQYFSDMLQLSRVVARGLALSLGLHEGFFVDKMQDPVAQLLLLRYPPPPSQLLSNRDANHVCTQDTTEHHNEAAGSTACTECSDAEEMDQQYVGCGAHTDCGFLTILAQDDVPGLQVKMASNRWLTAPSIPGAFIVNLGDMTARWTNDLYKSTQHRVFNNSSKARYSAPFFCNCNFDAIVQPADIVAGTDAAKLCSNSCSAADLDILNNTSSAGGSSAAKYEPIQAGHYIMQKLGLMWDQQNDQTV